MFFPLIGSANNPKVLGKGCFVMYPNSSDTQEFKMQSTEFLGLSDTSAEAVSSLCNTLMEANKSHNSRFKKLL